jgi:glycosyltransferase involved in cell wall biosynthesis
LFEQFIFQRQCILLRGTNTLLWLNSGNFPNVLTPSLSIIIPAYNEEKRLPSTLRTVGQFLKGRGWTGCEVIVVDDGSSDGTASAVEEFSKTDAAVRLLRNPGNRGKGYAVRNGMMEAKCEWLLFSDADLSTPIEEVDKLLSAVNAGVPIAIGSRAVDRSLIGVHQPAFRERAGQLFNLAMRMALRLDIRDTQCGFKLFRRDAARAIFSRQRLERFSFDAEILFIARKLGHRAVEVPVRWNHVDGTKVGMWSGAKAFLDLIEIRTNAARGLYRLE